MNSFSLNASGMHTLLHAIQKLQYDSATGGRARGKRGHTGGNSGGSETLGETGELQLSSQLDAVMDTLSAQPLKIKVHYTSFMQW
jgi:hypothetical protein